MLNYIFCNRTIMVLGVVRPLDHAQVEELLASEDATIRRLYPRRGRGIGKMHRQSFVCTALASNIIVAQPRQKMLNSP